MFKSYYFEIIITVKWMLRADICISLEYIDTSYSNISLIPNYFKHAKLLSVHNVKHETYVLIFDVPKRRINSHVKMH